MHRMREKDVMVERVLYAMAKEPTWIRRTERVSGLESRAIADPHLGRYELQNFNGSEGRLHHVAPESSMDRQYSKHREIERAEIVAHPFGGINMMQMAYTRRAGVREWQEDAKLRSFGVQFHAVNCEQAEELSKGTKGAGNWSRPRGVVLDRYLVEMGKWDFTNLGQRSNRECFVILTNAKSTDVWYKARRCTQCLFDNTTQIF
ncbi:hypothetical protein B0H14DRAFT_2559218 [Mycena olivaceomarginata]|nr:hypothetical protein B0H14DRAFT_2559218 [Mycena olivaceomarginata]